MSLNHFDSSLLESFANKYLKDWLGFHLEIEQVSVVVANLNCLIGSLFVWNVSRRGRSIDIVVRLDLRLILHVVVVIEFDPVVLGHHLLLLLVHFHLLLL